MFYPKFIYWAIPEKKNKQGRLRLYFFENPPWNFLSFYLTPEISRQKAQPLDISQNCVKSLGNSTLFFLDHPRKFHFVFNWPLEIPHAISLIPLEIPYPQPSPPPLFHPPCLGFFWNSPFKSRVRFLVSNLHKDAFTEI